SSSIVKKPTILNRHKNFPPNPKARQLISISANSKRFSQERKTSSPAAPPPSFSERGYKLTPGNKSTALFAVFQKIIQWHEIKR
ncbi:MAG: hypothetical protein K0M49_01410, partial [Arenimonas sp.]|nr:hypothetical protein [Arenimonas sp.]